MLMHISGIIAQSFLQEVGNDPGFRQLILWAMGH